MIGAECRHLLVPPPPSPSVVRPPTPSHSPDPPLPSQVDEELQIKAYYAGHVLGAAMFQIKVGSESVVYTVSGRPRGTGGLLGGRGGPS